MKRKKWYVALEFEFWDKKKGESAFELHEFNDEDEALTVASRRVESLEAIQSTVFDNTGKVISEHPIKD